MSQMVDCYFPSNSKLKKIRYSDKPWMNLLRSNLLLVNAKLLFGKMESFHKLINPRIKDEFMWRERAEADKFNAILNEIALQYAVNR